MTKDEALVLVRKFCNLKGVKLEHTGDNVYSIKFAPDNASPAFIDKIMDAIGEMLPRDTPLGFTLIPALEKPAETPQKPDQMAPCTLEDLYLEILESRAGLRTMDMNTANLIEKIGGYTKDATLVVLLVLKYLLTR